MGTLICIFVRNINRICVSKFQNVPHDVGHRNIGLLGAPSILVFNSCEYLVFTLLKNPQKCTRVFVSIFTIQIHSESIDPPYFYFFFFPNATYAHERLVLSFPRLYKEAICMYRSTAIYSYSIPFSQWSAILFDSLPFSCVLKFYIFPKLIFLRFLTFKPDI